MTTQNDADNDWILDVLREDSDIRGEALALLAREFAPEMYGAVAPVVGQESTAVVDPNDGCPCTYDANPDLTARKQR